MKLILQDKKIYKYPSLPPNHGIHMNHSSTLQQPGQFTSQQYSVEKPSDESQRGRFAASGISDYKRDSKYDCYADRLGSPKRMR